MVKGSRWRDPAVMIQILLTAVTAAGLILIWCQLQVSNRQVIIALEQTADGVVADALKATLRQEYTQAFSRVYSLAKSLAQQPPQAQLVDEDCAKRLKQVYVVTQDQNTDSLRHRLAHDVNLIFQTHRLIGSLCEDNDNRLRLACRVAGPELRQLDGVIDHVTPCLPDLRQELVNVRPHWQKVLTGARRPAEKR
ncbi:MAG: hypothetical protein V1797_05680 [Pseudomonadota bacterium]